MRRFNYCPIIEVGDVFTRIDRNRKVWEAKVINRTEYFVDVEKKQPYQVKFGDIETGGETGHYEDAPVTYERCMLHRRYAEVEVGESEKVGLYGTYISKDYKKVPTAWYYIDCKEDWSAHSKYDRPYELRKYGDGVNEPEDCQSGIDLFHKYCEEN